jgi:ATP-dependent DNA ligase
MSVAFEFCLPTRGQKVPAGPDWIHEVKYDGYRLRVERDGERVRLFTRNGYDWTGRYPWIVEAARKIRQPRFVLDGEAVILGVDCIADFNALHSRLHDNEVQLCAFDSWRKAATISGSSPCTCARTAWGIKNPSSGLPSEKRPRQCGVSL